MGAKIQPYGDENSWARLLWSQARVHRCRQGWVFLGRTLLLIEPHRLACDSHEGSNQ